jgi:hypothetical protein
VLGDQVLIYKKKPALQASQTHRCRVGRPFDDACNLADKIFLHEARGYARVQGTATREA